MVRFVVRWLESPRNQGIFEDFRRIAHSVKNMAAWCSYRGCLMDYIVDAFMGRWQMKNMVGTVDDPREMRVFEITCLPDDCKS